MKYRTLGKTGLEVSALGFGCMRLPVLEKDNARIDEGQATAMIRDAIDAGLNYLDTAWPYHAASFSEPGASEPFLARALRDGYRQKVYLATKLPSWMVQEEEDLDAYLNEQLSRLETEYIDLYLLHSLNKASWKKLRELGALDFLDRALKGGKIRHAGFSFHDDPDLFREIVDAYDWSFCQIMYNYYDENFQAGKEGMAYAAERGLGMVVMEPLRGGALVNGLPARAKEIFRNARPERSHAEWALRWLWKQPEVDVVLSGMSTPEQLAENLDLSERVSEAEWTSEDEEVVRDVKRVIRDLQRVPCTACGYCLPCPEGVDIPRNFTFCNDHHMLNDPSARNRYHNFLKGQQKASCCVQCGECEEKCPQQIPIRQELAHVAELFES